MCVIIPKIFVLVVVVFWQFLQVKPNFYFGMTVVFPRMKWSNTLEVTLRVILEMLFIYLLTLKNIENIASVSCAEAVWAVYSHMQNMQDSYLKSSYGLLFTDTDPYRHLMYIYWPTLIYSWIIWQIQFLWLDCAIPFVLSASWKSYGHT